MPEGFGLGRFSGRQLGILWLVLSAGLLLRILALDWGLPPSGPERVAAGLRSSYAMDEDNILEALARTDPARLDFDPHLYHWGTLHLNLTLATLEIADAAGVFGEPWREAWRGMHPGAFERIYVVGRLLSVAIDLLSALLAALIALRLASVQAALWAAALVALAPGQILASGQIRVDVSATACLLGLILVVLSDSGPFRIGLLAGLAVAAKYSMAPLALAALAVDAAYRGWAPHRLSRVAAGAAAGFLVGEPWLLTSGGEVVRQVGRLVALSRQIPAEILPSIPALLGQSLLDFARFSAGVPTAMLAVAGLILLWRRGGVEGRLPPAVFAAGVLALIPQHWPLLRYVLPLTPLAAIAAAIAIVRLQSWGNPLGAAALFVAGSAGFSVVSYRLAPHPANLALQVIERAAEPGQTVSRIMPEIPPLDPAVYPEGPNPLDGDLAADPPDWVVLSDLPLIAYPESTETLLRTQYDRTAVFRGRSAYTWATLGERGAPHDWKYSHPEMTIYRKR
jgi:hypothetical protein